MTVELDELTRDALVEILNIGIGRAASSLSEMVKDEVLLDIPTVELIKSQQADQRVSDLGGEHITAISQHFSGDFEGQALLFFPIESSVNLIRSLLQDSVPLEQLTELEGEALLEVGNIILNACFGTIANILSLQMESSLPQLIQGGSTALLAKNESLLMLINVNFKVSHRDINGYVSFVMDVGNFAKFYQHLQNYLNAMSGTATC